MGILCVRLRTTGSSSVHFSQACGARGGGALSRSSSVPAGRGIDREGEKERERERERKRGPGVGSECKIEREREREREERLCFSPASAALIPLSRSLILTLAPFLQAYADGVNAYAQSHMRPLEFFLVGYDPSSEPWRPLDSLVLGKLMGWMGLAQIQADMEKLILDLVQVTAERERRRGERERLKKESEREREREREEMEALSLDGLPVFQPFSLRLSFPLFSLSLPPAELDQQESEGTAAVLPLSHILPYSPARG